jgi:tetratricopeptide (TPR) repeat protein
VSTSHTLRFTLYTSLICLMLCSGHAFAAFPDIGLGARPMGMGGAFVAVASDANSIFWNPAGLTQLQRAEFSSMYLSLYGLDVSSQLLSGALRHPFNGGIGFGLLRMGEPKLYIEDSFILSFGQTVYQNLSIGGSVKRLSKSYRNTDPLDPLFTGNGSSASGLSYDLGALWRTPSLSVGLLAENPLPTQFNLSSDDDQNTMPLVLRLGLALRPWQERVTISTEGVIRQGGSSVAQRSLRIGAEFQQRVLGNEYISAAMLRGGVRLAEARGTAAYVGAGVQFAASDALRGQLDYAFALPIGDLSRDLGNTHRVSLSFVWRQLPPSLEQVEGWKRQLCIDSSRRNTRRKVTEAYQQWMSEDLRDSGRKAEIKKQSEAWQKLIEGFERYQAEEYNDAIAPLKEAINDDKSLAEARKILALAYWRLNQLEQAEQECDAALEMVTEIRFPDQMVIDIALSKDRLSSEATSKAAHRLATLALSRQSFSEAIAHFKTALVWSLNNEQTVRRQVTNAYQRWLELEAENKASIEAQQAVWNRLIQGIADFRQERYLQAITAFKACIRDDFTLTEAHKWLAFAYERNGDAENAEVAFSQFLQKSNFSLFSLPLELRGDLEAERVSPRLQAEFQANGVTLSQNIITPMRRGTRGWFIVDRENKRAYTVVAETDALKVYPGLIPMNGDPEAGRAILERLLAKPPLSMSNLGRAAFDNGDYEMAVVWLRQAVQESPQNASTLQLLALANWQIGRRVEAIEVTRSALRLDPGLDIPDEILQYSDELTQIYQEHYQQGTAAMGRKDYQTAIKNWKAALLWDVSEERIIRNQISRAYDSWLDNGFFGSADEKKRVQNQQAAWNRLIRGYQFYSDQDYAFAMQMFEESIYLDEALVEAYKWLGATSTAVTPPELEKAETAFQQARQLQSDLILIGDVPDKAREIFRNVN